MSLLNFPHTARIFRCGTIPTHPASQVDLDCPANGRRHSSRTARVARREHGTGAMSAPGARGPRRRSSMIRGGGVATWSAPRFSTGGPVTPSAIPSTYSTSGCAARAEDPDQYARFAPHKLSTLDSWCRPSDIESPRLRAIPPHSGHIGSLIREVSRHSGAYPPTELPVTTVSRMGDAITLHYGPTASGHR